MVTPYGRTFTLKTALEHVECWNCSDGSTGTIPGGTLILVEYANDSTRTTVMVKDGEGPKGRMGLTLENKPDGSPPQQKAGYRFIVENQALGAAIGVPMPKKTADLVGDIIAYETGEADDEQTDRLFDTLRETGIGAKLQGHYSSRMYPWEISTN